MLSGMCRKLRNNIENHKKHRKKMPWTRTVRTVNLAAGHFPMNQLSFLAAFASAIFMARTFNGSPNSVMKPSASWWSYRSPVVKEASDSLYKEYGDVVPALMMLPLYSLNFTSPVTYSWVDSTNISYVR